MPAIALLPSKATGPEDEPMPPREDQPRPSFARFTSWRTNIHPQNCASNGERELTRPSYAVRRAQSDLANAVNVRPYYYCCSRSLSSSAFSPTHSTRLNIPRLQYSDNDIPSASADRATRPLSSLVSRTETGAVFLLIANSCRLIRPPWVTPPEQHHASAMRAAAQAYVLGTRSKL